MRLSRFLSGYLLAALGFFVFLSLSSRFVAPDESQSPTERTAGEVAAIKAVRDVGLDYDNPLVLHRQVDYSTGEVAMWYPQHEAPILADLVADGKLPPVAERVGQEPAVMEGVDGIGRYGGTWMRIARTPAEVRWIGYRGSGATLVRFSPYGEPLVPHVAKSYTVSEDNTEFVFELRRGMKWSDGHPFPADDILYWWQREANDTAVLSQPPELMRIRGRAGRVEKLDTYRVKFTFPEPNSLFLVKLARGLEVANCPAHYLSQYHPTIGDSAKINRRMEARKLPGRVATYTDVKDYLNPEHPRLWPWLYRTYKSSPPQTAVRNPYYWVVDTQGNQLPYIDRILFKLRSADMIHLALTNGEASMQWQWDLAKSYTLAMEQREAGGFDVYHWFAGENLFVVYPNLNRRVDADRPETAHKFALLSDKRFRQALSVAINRQVIIDADYNGQSVPSAIAPEPGTPYYEPSLYRSYVQYDPAEANRLLDDIGLTKRDREGFRTYSDGKRMVFYLSLSSDDTGIGPSQFIVDDWAAVGVRVLIRNESRALWLTKAQALEHDFNAWSGNGNFPALWPEAYVPIENCGFARGFARWYAQGGLYGPIPPERAGGCVEPPVGHPLRQAMELYDRYRAALTSEEQQVIFKQILQIAAENVWTFNVASPQPTLIAVKDDFRNVPRKAIHTFLMMSPANTGIETYYHEKPYDSPGAIEQMKAAILKPTLPPDVPATEGSETDSGLKLGSVIRFMLIGIISLLVILTAVRHPYIGRRLLIMIPTLVIISLVTFFIIQLPPGDFLTVRIMQLQLEGNDQALQEIEELERLFSMGEPVSHQYARWLGLPWFLSFDEQDEGLLQGHMGRSMEDRRAVNDIVGDRILLTVLISLGTILFTWAMAIPIGIYSAVRQYSIGDYILTFIGFIGMCVPGFLLALLLIFASGEWFGVRITGLFSSQYGAQPEWTWGKVVDLLEHIWVPVVVLGVGGTASMIRIMRANLLDELKKPYVVTARAKGVRPMRLLFKYPVRMALNPFVSGIGGLFPQLVSGGAIVGIVMSLPTVGPLMLSSLMSEDMFLAGSMLMVLSMLGVLGTLASDLLLLWIDPRIRFGGGER